MKSIDWNNVQEATEGRRLAPGGYVCGIVKAEDLPDKEYLRILFDIAEGPDKNYFRDMAERMQLDGWPYAGILIRSYKPKAQPFFKGFLTAVEASNPGYHFTNDERTLTRKLVGLVLGEEEYEYNGEVRTRLRVASVRSVDAIRKGDYDTPPLKKLARTGAQPGVNDEFISMDDDEDIPF